MACYDRAHEEFRDEVASLEKASVAKLVVLLDAGWRLWWAVHDIVVDFKRPPYNTVVWSLILVDPVLAQTPEEVELLHTIVPLRQRDNYIVYVTGKYCSYSALYTISKARLKEV